MGASGEFFKLKINAGHRAGAIVLRRGISLHVSSTSLTRKANLMVLCARVGYTPH